MAAKPSPSQAVPRICPRCGTPIRLPGKPRDLGLLHHHLVFRVPVQVPVTELLIEQARQHCKMTPERLAVLRDFPHDRHWKTMLAKRDRRLEWFRANGQPPPDGFIPPAPGERDYSKAVAAMKLHWRKIRPLLSKVKRHPDREWAKLATRWLEYRSIRSPSRRRAALLDLEAKLALHMMASGGKVSAEDYRELRSAMLPDAPPNCPSYGGTDWTGQEPKTNAGGQL